MKRIIAWLLILLPQPVFAADGGMPDSLLPAGLKMVGALIIVLGIVLLLYYLSRKGFGFLPAANSGAIQVVETRYLMPKKAICLVKVRGKELLLGVGTERIEHLLTLESEQADSFAETLQALKEER